VRGLWITFPGVSLCSTRRLLTLSSLGFGKGEPLSSGEGEEKVTALRSPHIAFLEEHDSQGEEDADLHECVGERGSEVAQRDRPVLGNGI